MVNALLVYPAIEPSYWSFHGTQSYTGKKASMPPLGLLTVAAQLPDSWDIRVIDENVRPITATDITQSDLILASAMNVQGVALERLITQAHQMGVPIGVGGSFPTQYYDAFELRNADYFILGESETGVLDAFVHDFEKGTPKKAYGSMPLRNSLESRIQDKKEFDDLLSFFADTAHDLKTTTDHRPPLDSLDIPRYDLINTKDYASMAIQYSRGCPFTCDFCSETSLYGHKPRVKNVDQFISELNAIHATGYRGSVFVVDDNFIGDKPRVKALLSGLIDYQKNTGYPFRFYTEASINLAQDAQLMELMRDAGFSMVFVGLETPEANVLTNTRKYQNTKMALAHSVKTIQSYGIEVSAGFIVGLDGESADVADQMFALCQQQGIALAMPGTLVPMRGSELYHRYKRENRLRDDRLTQNTFQQRLSYVPDRNRSDREILDSIKSLTHRLYDKNGKNYFSRCTALLDSLGENPYFNRNPQPYELRAALQSLLRQPLRSYGLSYLSFMLRTLITKPSKLPEAFRLAIMGDHFISMTHQERPH